MEHRPRCAAKAMTAKPPNRDDGIEATTVKQPEDLDGAEAHILAERLDVLSNRLALDLSQLADSVEQGEEISVEDVEEIREGLRRVEDSLDRHLTEYPEPEEIPLSQRYDPTRTQPFEIFQHGEETTERLVEAPVEEVSWLLNSDLREIREITQTVDHNLLNGRLTDYHVGLLWNAGDRLTSWASMVLNHRLDGEILLGRADREQLTEEQKAQLDLLETEPQHE